MEKVAIGVDDVGLRELALDERNDVGEFVFAAVCTVGDCVHGRKRSCAGGSAERVRLLIEFGTPSSPEGRGHPRVIPAVIATFFPVTFSDALCPIVHSALERRSPMVALHKRAPVKHGL